MYATCLSENYVALLPRVGLPLCWDSVPQNSTECTTLVACPETWIEGRDKAPVKYAQPASSAVCTDLLDAGPGGGGSRKPGWCRQACHPQFSTSCLDVDPAFSIIHLRTWCYFKQGNPVRVKKSSLEHHCQICVHGHRAELCHILQLAS